MLQKINYIDTKSFPVTEFLRNTRKSARNNLNNSSTRPEVLCKKGVLRNFAKLTGKHLCQSLFFNKVAGLCLQLY